MAEDNRYQKLIPIVMTLYVNDVVPEDAVHRMALALEEGHIDSKDVSHRSYVRYLNDDRNTTFK